MPEAVEKREFSAQQRETLAEEGKAMPDGSFPIASRTDLGNALQSIGRAKDREAVLRHIRRRAKDLGAEDMLPEWAVAKVAKCSCSEGAAKAMDVLRQTTLADVDVAEFNDLIAAVDAAGGVEKTRGLARVVIEKAVREYHEGVAKGDYVGHPFRGNQHATASGASRGSTGASARRSTGHRAARRRAGRYTTSEKLVGLLNERLSPSGEDRGPERVEAEAFVLSRLNDSKEDVINTLGKQQDALAKMQNSIDKQIKTAEREELQADLYDDAEGRNRQYAIAVTSRMVLQLAKQTRTAVERAQNAVQRMQRGLDKDDLREAQNLMWPQLTDARYQLKQMDRNLLDRAQTIRSGYSAFRRESVGSITSLRGMLRVATDAVDDLLMEVEGAGDAARAMAQELLGSRE